jgi:hypothetical protein
MPELSDFRIFLYVHDIEQSGFTFHGAKKKQVSSL